MATGAQQIGYLIPKPSGVFVPRRRIPWESRATSSSPWKNKDDASPSRAVGFSDIFLPPNHHNPHLLNSSLSIRSPVFFYSLPLRPLLRRCSPHFSALFSSSMTLPYSSGTAAHADGTTGVQRPSPAKTVRVVIKGRVQGVFYRDWTVENATELKLNGWVRNRRDGSVEALFSGHPESVDDMVERCRRGPSAAMVTGLNVSRSSDDPGTGFERKRTA